MQYENDVLIIGGGIAGISLALRLHKLNPEFSITIITKQNIEETNTRYAQGGFSSVLSSSDSFESHISDTLEAGAGICRKDIVKEMIGEAPNAINQLVEWGVKFDRDQNNDIELGMEGGHHERRIAHVKDYTGLAIQDTLILQIKKIPKIKVRENQIAIDLVYIKDQIAGAYIYDEASQIVHSYYSKITVLASGGAGKVFRYTSNPDLASGDGIAMAYRAGARIANMEFIQFHPSILFNADLLTFLITEAIRGEGAIILNMDGDRFMTDIHELAELAPRDIVARAIDEEIKRTGSDHVLLDISFKDPEFIKNRFPAIYSTLMKCGVDMTKEPIPIVPGAHYTIGGIKAKINGETNLKGLLAIGEVANTGLHGANRLASNSLLEGSIMANYAAQYISKEVNNFQLYNFPEWEIGNAVETDEAIIITHNWAELRRLMWNYVGIVRTTKRLLRAKTRIELLKQEVTQYYWDFHVTRDIIELRNVVEVAELIVISALARKESRGAHYTSDYPDTLDEKRETYVRRDIGIHFSEAID